MEAVTVDGNIGELFDNERVVLAVRLQTAPDTVLWVGLGHGGQQGHALRKIG